MRKTFYVILALATVASSLMATTGIQQIPTRPGASCAVGTTYCTALSYCACTHYNDMRACGADDGSIEWRECVEPGDERYWECVSQVYITYGIAGHVCTQY